MSYRNLSLLLCLLACSRKIDGPTPAVTGARNERDQSTGPAIVCNAQGDPTDGWLVDALGSGFAPIPSNTLSGTAAVIMPSVLLQTATASIPVPDARVRFADSTRLVLALQTKDTAAAPSETPIGDYRLTVTNPNGKSGSADGALRMVPPPKIVSVSVSAPGSAGSGTNLCADQSQQLTINGAFFRTDVLPVVTVGTHAFSGSALTSVSATVITVAIPAGTFTGADATAGGVTQLVTVTNSDGCRAPYGSDPLAAAQITSFSTCSALGTLALSPRFGWQQRNQVVTITDVFSQPATQPFSGGAPAVTITAPLKTGGTASIPLRRVAFINASTITAVVPTCSGQSAAPFSDTSAGGCPNGIVPGGPYTITVQDPQNGKGSLSGAQGFVVVPNEPPIIASIAPTAIDTGGTGDLQINSGGLTGTNFAATSKPQVVFPAGSNLRACDLPITSQTTSVIHATVPGSVAQANCVEYDPTGAQVAATGGFTIGTGLYVIRVQDTADPAYGDYSGLVVTQPSKKPTAGETLAPALQTARADFPLVQAGDDIGNQYLYALGGIDGPPASGAALSSIEVAQITLFGTLGSFALLDRTALGYVGGTGTTAAPRHGLGAVAVNVPGDTSYVFVLGGIDPSGRAIANVERAQVLKAADAPVIDSPIVTGPGGNLTRGTYYYRVSAVLAASDPKNPGGETLASDVEPATAPASGKATLSWPCIPGAVKFRIFRNSVVNQSAATLLLLSERSAVVTSCTGSPLPEETFTDSGFGGFAGNQQPQPPGALGRWVAMTALPTARGQLAAKLAGDRIFAAGGCTTTTCNGPGGETASVDIALLAGASIASYSGASLTQARRQAGITLVNKTTAPGEFTTAASNLNDAWLMVSYGQAAGAPLGGPSATDVGKVIAGGSDVASPTFAAAGYGPSGLSLQGGWVESIADLLLVYGNTGGSGFDFRVPQGSTTICGGGPCTASSSFSATLTSASVSVTNRYLPGETLFRAYVYTAGGLTSTSGTAQSSVERILY
jgi:hypothetical protein